MPRPYSADSKIAYDVIMSNGVDDKGAILTQLSEFWFKLLTSKIPNLQTHFVSSGAPTELQDKNIPVELMAHLSKRSMVVKQLKVIPIESIVRGYVTGSAWTSYKRNGTICDIALPKGLEESQKLDQPLWTPSTKAAVGGVDENISPKEGMQSYFTRSAAPTICLPLVTGMMWLMRSIASCEACWY